MNNELSQLEQGVTALFDDYCVNTSVHDKYQNFLQLYTLSSIVIDSMGDNATEIQQAFAELMSSTTSEQSNAYHLFINTVINDNSKFKEAFQRLSTGLNQTDAENTVQDKVQVLKSLVDLLTNNNQSLGLLFTQLIQHIASSRFDSKAGEFATPTAICSLIVALLSPAKNSAIYDPVCGTGGFLAKAYEACQNSADLKLVGVDNHESTLSIAHQNAIINHMDKSTLSHGDSLQTSPTDSEDQFDFVIANPPFSSKNWRGSIDFKDDKRFLYGVPPKSNGDYAFILHCLHHLNDNGRAAIIVPSGALFRGGAEASIRNRLIENGFIEGVIALAANVFYGTAIAANILILHKNKDNKVINFIDATKQFAPQNHKNTLTNTHIDTILELYNEQSTNNECKAVVSIKDVLANDGDLSVAKYVKKAYASDTSESVEELLIRQRNLSDVLKKLELEMALLIER